MKIIELRISPEDTLTGVDATALVEHPAIDHPFYHFKDQINEFIFEKIVEDVIQEEMNVGKKKVFKQVVDIDGQLAFDNIEDALIYAKGIGCEGYHEHEYEGKTFYMACASHDDPAYTTIQEERVSEEFNHFEDLPIDRQELMLETLASKGITKKQLEEEYIILGEEDETEKFAFNVSKADANPDAPTSDMSGNYKVLYKYKVSAGKGAPVQSNTRNFCRRLIDMDLLFRKEDIDRMSLIGANSEEFGYYNIMEFKGSFNCRHRWNKVFVYQKKSMLPEAAAILADQAARARDNFSKQSFAIDGDKMITTGPAMIPNKLILRVDSNNEPYFVYFTKQTIKEIAEKMLRQGLLDKLNLEHNSERPVSGQLIESWFIDDAENDKANSFGFSLPEGSWMLSYKIDDPEIWSMIKKGHITGYSVEGAFIDRLIQE
jgi:hypothetical protein